MLRLADVVITPGGKGLNVARAALVLGTPASLVGFVPGHTGRAAAALIGEEGIELRACGAGRDPLDHDRPRTEPGHGAQRAGSGAVDGDWAALEAEIEAALADHRLLVCSGSLPPGAPEDAYARLARSRGRRTERCRRRRGAALAAALGAEPDVVAPNLGKPGRAVRPDR